MKGINFLILLMFSYSACFSQTIWQQSNGPYGGTYIYNLCLSPTGTMFASTYCAGLYKSTNDGNNWVFTNEGFPSLLEGELKNLCIAPSGEIYVTVDDYGIYHSTDDGNSWSPIWNINYTSFNDIIRGNNGNLYAFNTSNFFRSTNNGLNWTTKYMPSSGIDLLHCIYSSPDNILYMGAHYTTIFGSIYRSYDYGENWTLLPLIQIPNSRIYSITVSNNGIIYAGGTNTGVLRSTNDGANWVQFNTEFISNNINYLYLDQSSDVFACTEAGLYESTNTGENWLLLSDTQTSYSVLKKQTGELALLQFRKGFQISTDNGNNWTQRNNGIPNTFCNYLTVSHNNYIYAATDYLGGFRSTNNGYSWDKIFDENYFNAHVYYMAELDSGVIYAGSDKGLYRSSNGGNSWDSISSYSGINSVIRVNSGDLFAGTGLSVIRSTNNGAFWYSVLYRTTYSLVVNSEGYLFAGTSFNVYRSTNNGNNWVESGGLMSAVYSLAVDENGYIYAAAGNHGLFRSTNDGNNWVDVSPFMSYVYLVTTYEPNFVTAGGHTHGGVAVSSDNGNNWLAINDGLNNRSIYALAVDTGGVLFAGTFGAGVYRTSNIITNIIGVKSGIPQLYSLSQNYPNPFNPITKIKFSLPSQTHAKLIIYDVLGREISVLTDEVLKAGEYNFVWNASGFSSGIYFYRLEAGDFVETRKMVLLK